jgi:hypothetical protein
LRAAAGPRHEPVFSRRFEELEDILGDLRELTVFVMALDAKIDRLLYHFDLDGGEEEDRDG